MVDEETYEPKDGRPTREELAKQLETGERHVLEDADTVHALDKFDIEVVHRGSDGVVTLRYVYTKGYGVEDYGGNLANGKANRHINKSAKDWTVLNPTGYDTNLNTHLIEVER